MSTRSDEDFAREVESHVQLEADRLVEDGLPPEAARLEARRRFGNATLVRERFYYSSRSLWLDQLKQDVRTALRGITRYPIACTIAVISLAGGIGATTITLLLRNALFLAPPPLYQDPDALSYVNTATLTSQREAVPAGLFRAWLDDPVLAGSLGASSPARQQDIRAGDRVESRPVRTVTADLFTRLGVRPMIGTPMDEWPGGGDPPAMLSAGTWFFMFNQREDIVGQSILIDGKPHTIIGVMPRRFWFLSMDGPVWTRMDVAALPAESLVDVVVRRPPSLTSAALLERLQAGADVYAAALPADRRQVRAVTRQARGTPIGNNVGPFVIILLTGAVLLTLLIACTNVAVLMMAQWTSREHEIAIRASLGGARSRIIRSLLTESTLIAIAGGALGVALTYSLRGLAVRNIPTMALYDLTIDWTMIMQSALVTVAAGLLTGVAPAFYETRRLHVNPLNAIRGSDRVRQRWRHALVVFEIAVTVALLVSTGAMLSSYAKSLTDSPGFDTQPILSARVSDPEGVEPQLILERLRGLPGVASAEVTTAVPFLAVGLRRNVAADPSTSVPITARSGSIGPAYFATLDVPMRAGRAFSETDMAGSEPVAIVNDVLAGQLWPAALREPGAAIGKQVFIERRPHVVVGVVTGYSVTAIQPPRPMVFTPFAQLQPPPTQVQFMIRAGGDAAALTQTVRREIVAMGGRATVSGVTTVEQIKRIIGQEILVGTFPLFPLIGTGLLLTAAGIYGVLAFAVSRRATELAVRMAVGATGRDLLGLVAAHSVRMLGVGSGIGIALTYALTRIAQGRGGVFDSPGWQAFIVPMLLIAAIGTIATVIPMRRALKINPSSLLRST
ncbi:MAG TPA: ABC transporter permease [Vicinamibacterales bacterium]|nr:ABC transporter permease [Vicinamibacterales bacterium]